MAIKRIASRSALAAAFVLALIVGALCAGAAGAATIHACVKPKSGATRIVGANAKCHRGEHKLSWNTSGPSGARGVPGAAGVPGAPGANGSGPLFSAISGGSLSEIASTGTVLVSKILPPGTYMVWAKLDLAGSSSKRELMQPGCGVEDRAGTTGGGEPTILDEDIVEIPVEETEPGSKQFEASIPVPLQGTLTSTVTSTLFVSCGIPEGTTPKVESFLSQLQALAVSSES
jgi:hypothetical protein